MDLFVRLSVSSPNTIPFRTKAGVQAPCRLNKTQQSNSGLKPVYHHKREVTRPSPRMRHLFWLLHFSVQRRQSNLGCRECRVKKRPERLSEVPQGGSICSGTNGRAMVARLRGISTGKPTWFERNGPHRAHGLLGNHKVKDLLEL